MTVPNRERLRTEESDLEIQVTDDGSRTLLRSGSDDAYHSGCGAIAETRSVYLSNSGIAAQLAEGFSCRVLEIGFGTGISALVTIDCAFQHGAELFYCGLDHRLPLATTLEQLEMETWVQSPELAARYLEWRKCLGDAPAMGPHEWLIPEVGSMQLVLGNILDWNPDGVLFDAVYFDPFAPASNPELWTLEVFGNMAAALRTGGRLVTYCVSRQVRDICQKAGFDVQRTPGPPGGKREVMVATKIG